jgi:hypothetical protein
MDHVLTASSTPAVAERLFSLIFPGWSGNDRITGGTERVIADPKLLDYPGVRITGVRITEGLLYFK